MDALAWLRKRLEQASPDLLREMVCSFAGAPRRTRSAAPVTVSVRPSV